MHRESSDKLASEASAIMSQGNPCADMGAMQKLAADVLEAGRIGGVDHAVQVIKDHFHEFCETAKSLAASVVSQADGPEAK